MKKCLLCGLLMVWIVTTAFMAGLTTVQVDLERYTGTWYEIAKLPLFWQFNLVNVTATYQIREDGRIDVLNEGYVGSKDGLKSTARGLAWVPDPKETGKLLVQFFRGITSDYWVIMLDEIDYRYAVVSDPEKNTLWILSRTPHMDEALYAQLVEQLENWGFDLTQFKKTPQDW